MRTRTLLKIKRRPTVVSYDYEVTGKKAGDAFGTGIWKLSLTTAKSRHEDGKLMLGVSASWRSYREWLRAQGWFSMTVRIGWPRRVRLITLNWSDR